jgi:hypothetical protein
MQDLKHFIWAVHLNLYSMFEESIVNVPHVRLQSKNTNNAKSEVRFKQLIRDLQSVVRSQSTLQHLLEDKFK